MSPPLVLCYHGLSDSWPAEISIAPAAFERQIATLLKRGYRAVTFAEAVLGDRGGRALAVTFDDAYRSVLEWALPILSDLGAPATIFCPTGFVGTEAPASWGGTEPWLAGEHAEELIPMSWAELRSLAAAGWEIGSHTVSHADLPAVSDAALTSELRDSKATIEAEIGAECASLAYPYGRVDRRVIAAAKETGYRAAAQVARGLVPGGGPLAVTRVAPYNREAAWRFRLKTSPAYRAWRQRASRSWAARATA